MEEWSNGVLEYWKKKSAEDTRLRRGYGAARETEEKQEEWKIGVME
jgi:hypothetical protein